MKRLIPIFKNKALLVFLTHFAFSVVIMAQTITPPAEGDGSEANPYEIANPNNLYWLTQNDTEWGKHFIQTADIDASETTAWNDGAGFIPIGNSSIKFTGSYNGQGFIVDNIQITRPNEDFIGFFGRLEDAKVEYLGITNVNLQGRKYVGGFFGHGVNSNIENCYSTGVVGSTTSTDWWSKVGGFAGEISSGDISACYTTVNVSSSKGIIGGFIGINGGAISNCYAAGEVTGNTSGRIGGFSGQNSGTIRDSYSIGHVSVDDDAKGGFNGYSIGGTILSCFWDKETSGLTVSDGGTELATSQIKNASNFISAGWDFAAETANGAEDIWGMNCADHDGYPYLMWQGFTHDANYPELNAATLDDLSADCEVSSIEAPTATDDCMGEIIGVCNTSFPIVQSKVITWTFDDTNGQVVTQTQEVTILDDVAPVLDNATLTDITTECEVTELTAPTATDNCSGIIEGVPDVELPITSSTVVTWTYTDNNGNSVSQTQNIEITSDTTDPVPDEETLADIITQCDITELPIPTATDNCAGIIEAVHDAEFPITSPIVVTWTYTDNNGNSVSQTQNIEITGDIVDPVPDEGTLVDLTAVCEVNELSIPTATDNCAGIIEGVHDAEFPIISSTVVTWTYTDNDGNSTTQTQNIIIEQVPTPQGDGSEINPFQIATLENLYWLTNKASVWDKHFIQTTDIDASETSTWEEGAGFSPIGNNTYKFTGFYNGLGFIIDNIHISRPEEDNIGVFGRLEDAQIENLGITNASIQGRKNVGGFVGVSINSTVEKCYSTGTVQSTTSPDWWSQVGGFAGSISSGVISACYATVSVSSSKGIIGGFVGANVGSISNCYATGAVSGDYIGRVGGFSGQNAGTISSSFSSGRTSSNNSALGGFNGFDSGGTILDCFWDKESSGFTVSDGGIGLVSSQIKNALSLIDAGWDFASETENGTDDIWGMNCSDNEGYPFLIWQGFDHDDIDPVPDAISLSVIESDCHITTLIPPAASDNSTGTITGVTDVELPITSSTVITWRYDDTNGQVITQTQEVIISDDVIAPVPDEETLADIIKQCEITELTAPTATDNCSGQITGTHNATLPITGQGTTVITWTYTDDNGNSVTQMQNAIIEDTTAPVPNSPFPADITAECQVSELTAPTATDNCCGQIVGTHNAILPINTQGTTVITWSYTDSYGNTATQTQNVIIEDSTAPVPDHATLSDITAVCEITELSIPTATDNCDGMINGTHNIQLPITSSMVITWSYTDDNGNSVTQTQNLVIEDTEAPVPDNATLADTSAECEVTELTAPTATDNCSGQIVGNHNITLPITEQGTTEITWTYTDDNGNSVTQTQNVVIEDSTAPIPDNATLSDILAECEVAELAVPTATDNCNGQVVGTHNATLPITTQGTTEIIWTYIDNNGNSATQMQNVVIEDTEAPIPDNATLSEITATSQVVELIAPTATDNCSGQVAGTHDVALPVTTPGTTIITWTYTDSNGNSTTQMQNLVIVSSPEGEGTETNPYEIANLDNLLWLSESSAAWDKHFIQTADIDASETTAWNDGAGFIPIGNSSIKFTGSYNGQGFIVDNIQITRPNEDFIGFFGRLEDAKVEYLGITNVNLQGRKYVGGFFGHGVNSNIENCYSTGVVESTTSTDWWSKIGGFAGEITSSDISGCYTMVNVSSNKGIVGGFIGLNGGTISNCFAAGEVTGTNSGRVGGFSGQNSSTINYCYSIGVVSVDDPAKGGFNGFDYGGIISSCFWDQDSSGLTVSDGGTGLSTVEMKNATNFISSGWDFASETENGTDDIWGMNCTDHDGYPFLTWQGFTHDDNAPIPDVATLEEVVADCEVLSIEAPTATDDCMGQVVGNHNATLPITTQGTTVVIWTFTDNNGNTATQIQNVVIEDTEAPQFDKETLVDITAECQVAELIAPTATDNCVGTINGVCDVELPITSSTVITWTYTDNNGNVATQMQNVVIEDAEAPVPNNATLADITAVCQVATLTAPTATDNCNGQVVGTHNATLPITTQGTTEIIWTYIDNNGNSATQMQNVVIEDTEAPVPDNTTLSDITAVSQVTELTAPTATDNCSGQIVGTHDVTLPVETYGTTVVTWTYTDGNGNSSTQTQNLVIMGTPEGDGSEANPYEIANLDNLLWLSESSSEWDKHYIQTADIDASETSTWNDGAGFIPIGNSSIKFTGSYNGQGYIVKNIQINRPNQDFIGFFGRLEDANVENLGITNVSSQGEKYVGGFFGHSVNSTIAKCYSTGVVQSTTSTDWWSQVGGFAGAISSGDISACYTTVNVSSSKGIIGGFVGSNAGSISNCYATGAVAGTGSGRVGSFSGQNTGTISRSYSTGPASVDDPAIGGFNGFDYDGTITSCFWDTESSGLTSSDGGTGLTTVEMKNALNFINAGWDFASEAANGTDDIWGINCTDQDGYPLLMWQGFTHDDIAPTFECIGNTTVNADETHKYIVEGDEFDPKELSDNCEVVSIMNDFNNQSTLAGTHLPEGTTTVMWTVTDNAGNTNTCSFNVVVNAYTTGVDELQQAGIKLYPNPVTHNLTVKLGQNRVQRLTITDLTGRVVFTKENLSQTETLDISNLNSGVYLINVQTTTRVISTRIVKE